MPTTEDLTRYRRNRQSEVDSAAQYLAMASREKEPSVAQVYRELAGVEERHARFWEERLKAAGAPVERVRPSWRAQLLVWVARRFGAALVLPTVTAQERADRNGYVRQPEAARTSMASQERMHARLLSTLLSRSRTGVSGSVLAGLEGRHHTVGGNALRAAVLGANDGLCSNLSLVMGVAGASVNTHLLLVAGLAGLLAGAFSMALGEWVSVTSARELAERELSIEADEMAASPEDERTELQLIYESKGIPPAEARALADQLIASPQSALDVLSREELGLNPDDLGGSPWVAAGTSFVLFALGALVPVLPLLFLRGAAAVVASLVVSGLALFAVGAAITVFTGRPVWRSGGRQLLLGLAAAAVTFAIGRLVGVALG